MAAANVDLFDQYFKRADLDRDGRISGAEAVAFFQGSNLPKPVLAQIWMHADQNRTGFLGRPEFYNALKLVTVAQSGRELTPDIVKAALFGPAAAKIPAPKINPVPVPAAQMGSMAIPRPHPGSIVPPSIQMGVAAPPSTQMGVVAPPSQNFGFRGPQVPPNVGVNQQAPSSFNNSFMRPGQATPAAAPVPVQGASQGLSAGGNLAGPRFPGMNTPNLSTDWLGSKTNGASAGGVSLSGTTPGLPPKPQTPTVPSSTVSSKPLDPALSSFQPSVNDSRALVPSGNGFSSDSVFGGETFSTTQAKPGALTSTFSASSMSSASSAAPVTAGSQNSVKQGQPDPFQNILTLSGSQLPQSRPFVKQNQLDSTPSTAASSVSNVSVGAGSSTPGQAQLHWPKIQQSDIRKYTKVFLEVDKDRDGRITGQEARNLFLSWRLPREVLKQVWDLSDQDNDSMLSLREFCIALYLMERYREGRPLPAELPHALRFDETLLQATGQPSTAYGGPSWPMSHGLSQQGIPGSRPVMSASGLRPPMHNSVTSLPDGVLQQSQNMLRGSINERNFQNQHNRDEQGTQVAANEGNEVQEKERILDSREKVEFYRTKMQELVLYRSRCDNRLNEISERASSDKREVESLAKKYEEKYKQVADIASKLTVEEANFRHVQERKVELQNAIVKMEQGGSVDGLLQVRADRIQSDLEELAKALSDRCRQRGIDVKTTASVELPFGWQPGIQEGAVDWDEEWDKFEDEGFSIAKELSDGTEDVAAPENSSPSLLGDEIFTDEVSAVESSSHVYSNTSEHITENGSTDGHSEDGSVRSPRGSTGRSAFDSPRDFRSPLHDVSPHARDSYSDHGGAESTFSGDKFGDESSWGANFDTNDDVDSVWGFNAKDTFGAGDYGLNPIKVDSPSASSEFGKDKKSSFFADSVPGSPLFNSSSPIIFNDRSDNHSFDTSSRFDSFSMRDGGLFQQRESLSRFDSIRSTSDFGHGRGFSFDDGDPFGSTGPFKSTGSHSPRKGSDNWNAF